MTVSGRSIKAENHENIFRAPNFACSPRFPPLRADIRSNATQGIVFKHFIFLPTPPTLGVIVTTRSDPRGDEDAAVGRPRGTTAERLRVVADATPEAVAAVAARSKPDPRLVAFVRLLARQAARDFVQAEYESRKRDQHPD